MTTPTPRAAIDWQALLARLQSLAQHMPQLAADIEQFIQDVISGVQQKQRAVAAARPGCCPDDVLDCLSKHLDMQRDHLVEALCCNLCMTHCVDSCSPKEPPAPPA